MSGSILDQLIPIGAAAGLSALGLPPVGALGGLLGGGGGGTNVTTTQTATNSTAVAFNPNIQVTYGGGASTSTGGQASSTPQITQPAPLYLTNAGAYPGASVGVTTQPSSLTAALQQISPTGWLLIGGAVLLLVLLKDGGGARRR
jgi:hypothetical protein